MSREELYQQIWTESMRSVAARLGVSPAVLARLCRRMDVPYPRRGDKVRREILGDAFPRPPLSSATAAVSSVSQLPGALDTQAPVDVSTVLRADAADMADPLTSDEVRSNVWPHCLLADEDVERRTYLRGYLERYGLKVLEADSAESVRLQVRERHFDVVLVDTALPGDSSHELCRWLHSVRSVVVILMSSEYDPANWVLGFEMGASDCVSRSASPRELVARIKAVLRRAMALPWSPDPTEGATLRVQGWSLDALTRRLVTPHSQALDLSGAELRLLWRLMAYGGRVQSRAQLKTALLDENESHGERYVDAVISRLRMRVEAIYPTSGFLQTVRGEGYIFKHEASHV